MATTAKTTKGFTTARCPFCNDEESSIQMSLSDMECTCDGCNETFTVEQARDRASKLLAEWDKITRWVAIGRELAAE
jgi:transcription elongation factor Elf1